MFCFKNPKHGRAARATDFKMIRIELREPTRYAFASLSTRRR